MNKSIFKYISSLRQFKTAVVLGGLISLPFVCYAQSQTDANRYDAGILWNVKGNVKSIKYDKNSPQTDKTIKFTPEGKVKNRPMSYDADKRPIGFGSNFSGVYNYMNVAYDDNSNPQRIRILNGNGERTETQETVYNYRNGSLESAITSISGSDGNKTTTWNFTDYQFDPNGNWISRKVSKTSDGNSINQVSEEFTEKRKIEYYK